MKGISEISGLQSIKSMYSTGKKSTPRTQSSAYLDLYILRKGKDRLEKEIYILKKRKKDAQKKLNALNKHMDKLQTKENKKEEKFFKNTKKSSGKEWKTMPLTY